MLLLLLLLCVVDVRASLTERETYEALLASITALEARGTAADNVKISLIIQSTDFLTLQAKYATTTAQKRFLQK